MFSSSKKPSNKTSPVTDDVDVVDDVEVLVIGAGPVGLTCALEAHRMGATKVRVVDAAAEPMRLCKASTVWPRTMELLKYGHPKVYENMYEYANKASTIGIYRNVVREGESNDGNGNDQSNESSPLLTPQRTTEEMARIELYDEFQSEIPTACCLEQFVTEGFLRDDLEERFGCAVERGVRATRFQDAGDHVRVELRNEARGTVETVRTKFLVGCDGAHSFVRRTLNLHYPGELLEDRVFLISHCAIDGLPFASGEIWTVLNDNGVAFAVPMPNDTWELIFDLDAAKTKEMFGSESQVRDPTVAEMNQLLKERVPGVPDNAIREKPQWLGHFRVHSRQVERYSVGRVFMCGDACHIHSPVGGQGMNFGMQDAFNLGWKLGLVCRGVAGKSILNSYHRERHPLGRRLVSAIELQTRMVMSSNAALRRMQYLLLPMVGAHADKVAKKMAPFAGETVYDYRDSPLSVEHWCFESLSKVFSAFFFHCDPTRVLQRRRTGITRFLTQRVRAGDRVPNAKLTTSFGLPREPGATKKTFSKRRLLFGGHDDDDDNVPNENSDSKDAVTVHSLCGDHAGFTALLFEAAPGYADESFGHGGQEVADLDQVAWKLETLTDGLVRAHVLGPAERAAQRAFAVAGQCLYLVRPDGYVAFRSQPVDVGATVRYLRCDAGATAVTSPAIDGSGGADDEGHYRHRRESDATNKTLGLVVVLLLVDIGLTWYTRNDGRC